MTEDDRCDYILDAWALLAHFENEPAGKRVAEILTSAQKGDCALGMSIINMNFG